MIAIGLALKTFFSGALKLFLEYWYIIIPALLIAYLWNDARIESNRADKAVSALNLLKTGIDLAAKTKTIEDALKRSQAAREIELSHVGHTKQIEVVKNEYEKRNKVIVNTVADLRHQLRERVRSDAFNIPEIKPDTAQSAEEWRNSYRTVATQYQNLKDACIVTTLDYNSLRDWADSACRQVGCE